MGLVRRLQPAVILALGFAGCAAPRVYWSQRVVLNGRQLVFERLWRLNEGPDGHRVAFLNGDFIVEGKGPIVVNELEISAAGEEVWLANQRLQALKPDEEVHFTASMAWQIRPPARKP